MLISKNYVRLILGISVLAFALSNAACAENATAPSATPAGPPAAAAAMLTGPWKLQSLTRADSTTVTVDRPDLFTLEFLEGDTRLALRVDCNRATGAHTTSGTTLTMGPFALTKAYCAATAAFGDEYVRLLDGESVITAAATSLVLSSPRGTLRFGK